MKYVNDYEAWYRVFCPYCKAENWYSNGDERDYSGIDIDAVECRECKTVFGIGLPIPGASGEHVIEKGRKMVELEITKDGILGINKGCKMVESAENKPDEKESV